MINIHSVGYENYSVYKNVEFVVPKGISIIRGKNASGKSLIGHALPLTFWEHPVASKKLKSVGSSFVKLINNDKYFVTKTTGKSTKYRILKNGKDLKLTTIKESEKIVERAFSVSPEYFWNCCYISSSRPCQLQFCSPTERLVHFQNLFNLNIYEQIHDRIKELLREKKANKHQAEILQSEKDGIMSGVEKVDEELLKKLEKKNADLKAQLSEIEDVIAENNKYESIKSLMTLNFGLDESRKKMSLIVKKLEALKKQEKKYQAQLEAYQNYKESLKYKDALDISKLRQLASTFNSSNLRKLMDEERWLSVRQNRCVDEEKYRNKLPTLRAEISLIESELSKLNKLKGEERCPLCGHKLKDSSHAYDEIKRLEQELEEKKKQADIANKCENFLIHKDRVWCKSDDFKYILDFIEEELDKAQEARKYRNAVPTEKPEKVDESLISSLEDKKQRLDMHISLLTQLSGLKYKKLDVDVDELRDKQESTFRRLTSLSIKKESYDNATSKLQEIDASLEKLDYEDLELLELLYDAYGNKGIKSKQIEVMLDTYCKKMNEFAQLLYADKITFTYKIDQNKCELFAERNGKVGDISTLSGAETRFFQMTSALALICMLGIRVDTMWLDEMENGLSKEHLEKFTQQFLPQLRRYIPKIVLITPRSYDDLYVSGAKEFIVEKIKNVSKLKEAR